MKKIQLLTIAFLAVSVLFVPQSCTFDTTPADFNDIGICFETEILPLFVSNCTGSGCHNSIDKEEGYDLTTYEGILDGVKPFDANNSELVESMVDTDPDDIMPPPPASPLSAAQIGLIKEWINLGAPNTINCVTGSCDSLVNVSFAVEVFPILQTNCAGGGCHDANTVAGGYNYTSYNGVKASVNSNRLLGSVNHQGGFSAMPPSYSIANCDIKKIEVWINEGALDN